MTRMFMAGVAALALAAGTAASAQNLEFKPGTGDFTWSSYNQFKDSTDLSGQSLTIFGPWIGPDQDHIQAVLNYFEAATGAKVNYTGSDSFEQQIVVDIQGGSPPNIAVFPQPGLMSDLAGQGKLTPLPEEDVSWLKDNYAAGQSWADLSSAKGPDGKTHLYAFPYKADLKSLVWYVPENFSDAGYKVPKTMEELKALTKKIADDGGTPWCIGLGSGSATGWPATDWVEDLMLRMYPPQVYDDWVSNKLKFDDPKVIAAIKEFGWFAKNDKFVAGGAGAEASTDFRDSPKGLFSSPPQCYMHHQASFIPTFFPKDVKVGTDVDFFYFPPYADKNLGRPVLGAGTIFSITKDSPAAEAFIKFLKTPIAHEIWMARQGFLTPFKKVNTAVFSDPVLKKMNDILLNSTTFRFDGSDQMPGAVGTGSFWTGMVDYVGGKSAEEVAKAIQDSWPSK